MERYGYNEQENPIILKRSYKGSQYTRDDSERFDEVGNFIPYQPTEEELSKKEEIKKALKEELAMAYEEDPMDSYTGIDTTEYRVEYAMQDVAKQFGVDQDFVEDVAGELQREQDEKQFKEYEWANTPGNLTPDEYDAYMMGELDISDRITSGCHGKSKKDKKKKKAVKSGTDYSGENKAKMLAKMANEMSYPNNPDYKRFMEDFNNKRGAYKALVQLTYGGEHADALQDALNYSYDAFKSWIEDDLKQICEWEYDRNFISRLKKYSPQAWDDILEKSAQLVKDNLTSVNSSRQIKSSVSSSEIKEGNKFKNPNNVIIEVVRVEPDNDYVLYKIGDGYPKDTTVNGIIALLGNNSYELINSSKQIKSSYPKTDKQNSFNWSYNSWIGRFVDDLAYTDRYLEGIKWFDNNKSSLDALCKEYDCYPVSDNEKAAFYNALREVGEITSSRQIKSSKFYTSYDRWKDNTAVLPVSKSTVMSFFEDGSWSWDDMIAIVGSVESGRIDRNGQMASRPAVIFGSNSKYEELENGTGLFNDQSWNDIGYFSFQSYSNNSSVFQIPGARYFVLK